MALSQTQLNPVSEVLTEHIRQLKPGLMIADKIFPPLDRPNQTTGQLMILDDNALLAPSDTASKVGTEAQEAANPTPTYLTFTCTPHRRRILLPNKVIAQYANQGVDSERVRAAYAAKPAQQLMLAREIALSTKLNSTANYESGYSTTIGAGDVWTGSGGDPVGVIETALATALGFSYNVAIGDRNVWYALRRHSALTSLTKYVEGGMVTDEGFASIFGLTPIIGNGIYNAAGTITRIWGDSLILAYIPQSLTPGDVESDMCFGRTIYSEQPYVIEYDAPNLGGKMGATWIEAGDEYAFQFIGVDNSTDGDTVAGYLIDNAI